jgi:hypothetical protein
MVGVLRRVCAHQCRRLVKGLPWSGQSGFPHPQRSLRLRRFCLCRRWSRAIINQDMLTSLAHDRCDGATSIVE